MNRDFVIEICFPYDWTCAQCSDWICARFSDPVLWGNRTVLVIAR